MKLGSFHHKKLFCRQFLDSYLDYEPETLPWPELDSVSLERLRGIPFWQEALYAERKAGKLVGAFAQTIEDPLLQEAITLQAQEENRHARLIEHLIQRYDIPITEPEVAEVPEDIEAAFTTFGFEECLDSFFAFGMFGIAHQAQYMPEAMFEIFAPILDEEARHIVFFVNWVTYRQIQLGRQWIGFRAAHALWFYSQALLNVAKVFGGAGEREEQGFTATSASGFMENLTPEQFFTMCLAQNQLRMGQFDPRLLQPSLLPKLSQLALTVIKLWPRRYPAAPVEVSES